MRCGPTIRWSSPAASTPLPGEDRRPLWGSLDQIRGDLVRYADAGLDELFVELNFDPDLASPGSDPEAAMATALLLLEELAPGRAVSG